MYKILQSMKFSAQNINTLENAMWLKLLPLYLLNYREKLTEEKLKPCTRDSLMDEYADYFLNSSYSSTNLHKCQRKVEVAYDIN